MIKYVRLVLVGLLLIAMVIPTGMACGTTASAATSREAVVNYLEAYADKDAATMDKYETADNKAAYETAFGEIDSLIVTNIQATKVAQSDTAATYKAAYNMSITVDGVPTGESKSYTVELENDGGWLITSDHMDDLFPASE